MRVERGGSSWLIGLCLVACQQAGDSNGSSPGSPSAPEYAVACSTDCPTNTRLAKQTAREVQEQGGIVIVKDGCTSKCIPEQPCLPPFVPRVTNQGGKAVFECAATDGLSGIPKDSAVDFGFASKWSPTPDILLRNRAKYTVDEDKAKVVALRVGDFDGDGKPELAALVAWEVNDALFAEVRTLKLTGATLTQTSATPAPAFTDLDELIHIGPAADFDGDGKTDLLAANKAPHDDKDSISLLLARSTGAGFALGAPIAPSCYRSEAFRRAFAVAAGDFDGDGKADAVLLPQPCDGSDIGAVTIRAGGVGAPTPLGMKALSMASGDVDKDGRLDLLFNQAADRYVSFLNQSGLVFTKGNPDGVIIPSLVAVVDLSGDGFVDLLGVEGGKSPAEFPRFLGDGKGGFTAASPLSSPVGTCFLPAFGDVDGDGKPDLVCAFEGMLAVTPGSGAPPLSKKLPAYPEPEAGVVVADLDGDARAEMVFVASKSIEVWVMK